MHRMIRVINILHILIQLMKNQEFLGKFYICRLSLKAKPGLVSRNDPAIEIFIISFGFVWD